MKKQILKYLAGRFIPAIVNIALVVLAVRFLGPAEYGKYSLLLYTALLAITLSFHWVQVSILRFLGGLPGERNVVMSRFFDLTALSALFSTLMVMLAGIFYFHLDLPELILVSLFTFLNHFYLFHQAILQAFNRSVRMAILEGADQLLIIGVLLVGIFFFHWRSSVLLLGSLVVGLAGVLALRSIIREKGLLTVDLAHLYWDSRFSGKVVEFGYGLALWLFFSHLMMAADRFILMEYLGYGDSGMYAGLKDLLYKGVTFATLPIYISYQAKIVDQWNARHKKESWEAAREALSFEFLIFIIVFIIFMVGKQMLFNDLLKIPKMDSWFIYLPVLLSAFLWQVILLLQRFLELTFRYSRMLAAIGVCVVLNVALNLVFVPRYGLMASSAILLATTLLYAGYLLLLSLIAGRRLTQEE